MSSFLLLASPSGNVSEIKGKLGSAVASDASLLDVPDTMKKGFDELNAIVDEANKCDSSMESIVRRIERVAAEIECPVSSLTVGSYGQSIEEYISTFKWDSLKFPTSKSFEENWKAIQALAGQLDKTVTTESSIFTELKGIMTGIDKNATAGLSTRNLTDVLGPTVVNSGYSNRDFVETEHLTTMLVVVPSAQTSEFEKEVETFGKIDGFESTVIAGTKRKFAGITDRENNTLWRVVIFKKGKEEFSRDCRQRKWSARDFEYSEESYQKCLDEQKETGTKLKSAKDKLTGVIKAAYGEVVICWAHLKVMRLMADSALRSGPSKGKHFIILKLAKNCKEVELRKALESVCADASFGQEFQKGDKMEGMDDAEYYAYASVPFQPKAIVA